MARAATVLIISFVSYDTWLDGFVGFFVCMSSFCGKFNYIHRNLIASIYLVWIDINLFFFFRFFAVKCSQIVDYLNLFTSFTKFQLNVRLAVNIVKLKL